MTKIYFSQTEINQFLYQEQKDFYSINIKENKNKDNLLIDNCADYFYNNHAMWLYFKNGNTYTPLYVCDKPFIPIKECKLNISKEQFNRIKDFVSKNRKEIIEFSNGRMDFDTFRESLMISHFTTLNESSLLIEMPTFPYYTLDLPTDIWIDGERNLQHQPRIKFNDTKNKDTRTWATMTIDRKNPEVYNLSSKTFLSNDEINFLKKFVVLNYNTLMKAAKGEFKTSDELKRNLKRISLKNNGIIMPVENGITKIDFIVIGSNLILTTNDDKGRELLNILVENGVFQKYDDNSIYNDIKTLLNKSGKNKLSAFVKNVINNAANSIGVSVEYLNIEKLYRISDRFN